MKIGIIGAMESEIQLLREYLGNPAPTHLRRYAFYEGQIGNHQVVVLLSGIGKVSASIGTALLIDHFAPELVINTGTAGGLRHSKVFDMVLVRGQLLRCRCHSLWLCHRPTSPDAPKLPPCRTMVLQSQRVGSSLYLSAALCPDSQWRLFCDRDRKSVV